MILKDAKISVPSEIWENGRHISDQFHKRLIEKKKQEDVKMGYNVAIDGPSGAGKSTIAKLVAKEKG